MSETILKVTITAFRVQGAVISAESLVLTALLDGSSCWSCFLVLDLVFLFLLNLLHSCRPNRRMASKRYFFLYDSFTKVVLDFPLHRHSEQVGLRPPNRGRFQTILRTMIFRPKSRTKIFRNQIGNNRSRQVNEQ